MHYFPLFRYEHDAGHPNDWQRVQVELVRHDATPEDECTTEADLQETRLPAGTGHVQLMQPFCLEKNQRYEVKVTFLQYDPSAPGGAKILIDSVIILPSVAISP